MPGPIRVLVVEGDPAARLGLEQVLRREQFEPAAVATVADAIPSLAGISILLIDPVLPDEHGAVLLAHIASKKIAIHIGIISAISRSDPKLAGLTFDAFFESRSPATSLIP